MPAVCSASQPHFNPCPPQVEAWPPAFYAADPVVHALRDLFVELAVQERQCQAAAVAGGGGAGGQRQQPARGVVNPNRLREALAAVPGTKFQEGGHLFVCVYVGGRGQGCRAAQRGTACNVPGRVRWGRDATAFWCCHKGPWWRAAGASAPLLLGRCCWGSVARRVLAG